MKIKTFKTDKDKLEGLSLLTGDLNKYEIVKLLNKEPSAAPAIPSFII